MRICFVLPCAGTRGAPRSLLETITVLQARGVECYALLPVDGPLIFELQKKNVTTRIIPYKLWMTHAKQTWPKRIGRPIFNLLNVRKVAKQIKRWNCDLVYTNTVSVGIGGFSAALARRPHVWHIREFGWEDHHQPFDLGDPVTGWLLNKLSDLCLVNAEAVGQKFAKWVKPSKIKRAHQAVRLAIGESDVVVEKSNRFHCVIAGNLQPTKGQEEAVLAISHLVQKGLDVELSIVGDGPEKFVDKLKSLIAKESIADRVKFVGYVPSTAPYFKAADVVLVCSKCEAFGRVTVEGMLAGKPVVGARSGGTTELLIDGENGYGYQPGNARDLADKIAILYADRDAAARMGEFAKAWAESQFNMERYGEEIWSFLSPLVPGSAERLTKWQSDNATWLHHSKVNDSAEQHKPVMVPV